MLPLLEALMGDSEVKNSEEKKEKEKKPPKIQIITTWMLEFSVYVEVMVKGHLEGIPSLAAYMAQIVQANRQFRGSPWVEYNTC